MTPHPLAAPLLALALGLAGFSPFQAEERNVREGNERTLAGDPAGALRRYDAAERAVGPRAELDYDRGDALYRLGRTEEARQAWQRALERGAGDLSSRALQNVGTALAAGGDTEGAVAAFTEALRKDPRNEDARFDLEVLLRKREARGRQGDGQKGPGKQGEGKPEDAGQGGTSPQAGASAPPPGPGPQPDRKEAADGKGRPPQPAPAQADARPGPEAGPSPGAAEARGEARAREGAGQLAKQDAARLLDALRARERSMPLAGAARRDARRADADHDW